MPAMHRKWGVGQAFSALIDETLGKTLTITVMVDASKPFKSVEVWGAFAGDRVKTASILRAGSGCLNSAPRKLSGFLPGYAERGAQRFCRGGGRA